jgi:hypothetical protein
MLQPIYSGGGGVHGLAVLLGFSVPMISSAFAGFVGSLIAGPLARSAFILWPLLIFGGMCLSEPFSQDPWREADYLLLANAILLYPAVAGSILPALWYWRTAIKNEPPSPRPPRPVRYYISVSLLVGVGYYCWARFLFLFFGELMDVAITFLLFAMMSPIFVGWTCFLISQSAGPTRTACLLLWPVLVIAGMIAVSAADIYYLGTMIGYPPTDVIALHAAALFIPGFIGSTLPYSATASGQALGNRAQGGKRMIWLTITMTGVK